MKIKYLGTAAHEGLPAVFCQCKNCIEARKRGGKNLRTRSQALINDDLLIDLNMDTHVHTLMYGIDLSQIHHCLITHAHPDHLYTDNINVRLPAYSNIENRKPFNVYGSGIVMNRIRSEFKKDDPAEDNVAFLHTVKPYEPFKVLDYEITALPAFHDPTSGPLIYIIKQGEKCMLYAHDTGLIFDEVFEYLKNTNIYFDFISIDCTGAFRKLDYDVHMNVERDIKVMSRLSEQGNADSKTIVYLNHFSHNADDVLYEEMSQKTQKLGFNVSYDGLEVEF